MIKDAWRFTRAFVIAPAILVGKAVGKDLLVNLATGKWSENGYFSRDRDRPARRWRPTEGGADTRRRLFDQGGPQ